MPLGGSPTSRADVTVCSSTFNIESFAGTPIVPAGVFPPAHATACKKHGPGGNRTKSDVKNASALTVGKFTAWNSLTEALDWKPLVPSGVNGSGKIISSCLTHCI